MIDVAKFLVWNTIVGVTLIIFDSYLIIKFFITLSLLCLFTFIQAVKMLIGIVYLVKYKCIISKAIKQPTPDEEPKPDIKMHIFSIIDSEKLK